MLTGTDGTHSENFFTVNNTNLNIQATAWLTDPAQWTKYKNEDAEFAIGSPTLELYAASFNAAAKYENEKESVTEEQKRGTIQTDVGDYGYTEPTGDFHLQPNYNKEIYTKDAVSYWWMASPINNFTSSNGDSIFFIHDEEHYFDYYSPSGQFNPVRPIVCIQTSVFKTKYENSLEDK